MCRNREKAGFTLLELLTVMAIMALLSTFAVTSYFGAIRGMTRRSAIKHLVNTLELAKQRAAMEGVNVSVLIYNEKTGDKNNKDAYIPSYVIVRELGRVSHEDKADMIYDEFTPLDSFYPVFSTPGELKKWAKYESIRLYNQEGEWKEVYPAVVTPGGSQRVKVDLTSKVTNGDESSDNKISSARLQVFYFLVNDNVNRKAGGSSDMWEVGTRYGIEVSPPNSLPRRFSFSKIDQKEKGCECIIFDPNGHSVDKQGKPTQHSVQMEEQIGKTARRNVVSVASTGEISYNEKWN